MLYVCSFRCISPHNGRWALFLTAVLNIVRTHPYVCACVHIVCTLCARACIYCVVPIYMKTTDIPIACSRRHTIRDDTLNASDSPPHRPAFIVIVVTTDLAASRHVGRAGGDSRRNHGACRPIAGAIS